ncbi:MAG: hypothetical protein BGO39_00605 [Chloroflexi bacterium 54-19]|nr:MAG: hypothetical protein BGO39_00605 [Chloroflexi bacterium 54-19]
MEAAFRYCQRVTRRGSRSFYLGSRLLPPDKRRAVWALYTFCRSSDDMVDLEQDGLATEARLAQVSEWERQVRDCFAGQVDSSRPAMVALAHTFARYKVPQAPVFELLEGMRMDLTRSRYASFEELELYCYRVASTVGLVMCEIIGYTDKRALHYAVKLGMAMQLTNILRDVGEDARIGRVYLPQEELRRFGYREEDLLAGVSNDRWRELLRFQIERARQYYRAAWPGIDLLDPACRNSIRVAARLYSLILDQIERNDYDVFTRRAYVPLPQKLLCLAKQLAGKGLQAPG